MLIYTITIILCCRRNSINLYLRGNRFHRNEMFYFIIVLNIVLGYYCLSIEKYLCAHIL